MDEEKTPLLENKKFLLAVGVGLFLLLVGIFVVSSVNRNRAAVEEEEAFDPNDTTVETYSTEIEKNYQEAENFAYENFPISDLLPVINEDPAYAISYDVSKNSSGAFEFKLTIEYKSEAGKTAALQRLKSSEFSAYNPLSYEIEYTEVSD